MSGGADQISAPQKLSAEHDLSSFCSGQPVLDEWLRRGADVVSVGSKVVGCYTLAVGAISHTGTPGRVGRNMPDPMPAMVLGRLAVDESFQVRHIGAGLLRDAVLRAVQAAEIAGIRAILVHAISAAAKRFYERYGFVVSPVDPLTVMITVDEALNILGRKDTK